MWMAESRGRVLSDASVLFLKVAALVLMVLDHVDLYGFQGALGAHATLGRVVAPAFALVLALNLGRMDEAALSRTLVRLLVAGALSSPLYWVLQGSALPLNILFSLAVPVAAVLLWRRGSDVLAILFALGAGLYVDYAWCGVAAVLLASVMLQRGFSLFQVSSVVAACFAVWNLSWWSFLVVPLVFLASGLQAAAPRLKWLFYVFYPAHLLLLVLLFRSPA